MIRTMISSSTLYVLSRSLISLISRNVSQISLPGTPARTRPSSPTRGAASRLAIKTPLLLSSSRTDPLKAFPTELSQRIFSKLSIKDLAKCARVSKKWARSQSLNYGEPWTSTMFWFHPIEHIVITVWFQHYRKENFQDDSLPPGKWTKRESKQNWVRHIYLSSSNPDMLTHVCSVKCILKQ